MLLAEEQTRGMRRPEVDPQVALLLLSKDTSMLRGAKESPFS